MGKLVFGMMQSLDGYVAGITGGPELPPPGIALHRYFNDQVRDLAGSLYGRRMYEVMRYWTRIGRSGAPSSTTSRQRGGRNRNGSLHAR